MAETEKAIEQPPHKRNAVTLWLRVEGLAVAALSVYFYARTGSSWWIFAALWLIPDLSMLGYLAGPRWGARCYNVVHALVIPAVLLLLALLLPSPRLMAIALVWCNHVGVDRLLGFGLKNTTGFGSTHLSN